MFPSCGVGGCTVGTEAKICFSSIGGGASVSIFSPTDRMREPLTSAAERGSAPSRAFLLVHYAILLLKNKLEAIPTGFNAALAIGGSPPL